MIEKIQRRLSTYRRRGLARSTRAALDVLVLSALRFVFKFNRWHSMSPTSLRPYRAGLAAMANSLKPQCVVEVGCGLGAILARIDAPRRVGYDIDAGVIRAARLLRSKMITFCEGGFADVEEPQIDLLVAINWPHDFPPEQVESWLTPLLARTRFLLLDRIERSSPLAYGHYHDFAFLAGRAAPVRTETLGEEHREFVLFEVSH